MSGLVGIVSPEPLQVLTSRVERASRRLSGANHAPLVHTEDGFSVAVSSHAASPNSDAGSFGEIAADGRYVLAIEGYVLNVGDLRARTDAPTGVSRGELVLRLFAREGEEALTGLNGACVIAIWDRQTRTAFLLNCPFGRRELFLADRAPTWAFASEPAVLPLLIDDRFGLNAETVRESFLCGVIYGEAWLWKDVTRPWPGSLCILRNGACERRLLDFTSGGARSDDASSIETTRDVCLASLDARLKQSAERLARVTPDRVVMMSGGIDSPLAAAYLRRVTGAVSTLTIGVPFGTDERDMAAKLARVLVSDHSSRLYDVAQIDLLDGMRRYVRVMQEPAWISTGVALLDVDDTSPDLPSGIVSGLGADILFGLFGFDRSARPSPSLFRYVINPVDERRTIGLMTLTGPHPDRLLSDLRTLIRTDDADGYVNIRRLTETASLVRLSARLSRHAGREALFAYLDRDVYHFALGLPPALREGDKPLLRALWSRVFPPDLMVEQKVPFVTHTLHWCYRVGRVDDVLDLLVERRTLERGVFVPEALSALVSQYRDRTSEIDYRWHTVVWQMAIFELFCREFLDRDLRDDVWPQSSSSSASSAAISIRS